MLFFIYLILISLTAFTLYFIYQSSAKFARLLDAKLFKRDASWALVDTNNFGDKCMALVTKQLSKQHYEIKIYENYNIRKKIVKENEFERLSLV
jgi:hypothetical protein